MLLAQDVGLPQQLALDGRVAQGAAQVPQAVVRAGRVKGSTVRGADPLPPPIPPPSRALGCRGYLAKGESMRFLPAFWRCFSLMRRRSSSCRTCFRPAPAPAAAIFPRRKGGAGARRDAAGSAPGREEREWIRGNGFVSFLGMFFSVLLKNIVHVL